MCEDLRYLIHDLREAQQSKLAANFLNQCVSSEKRWRATALQDASRLPNFIQTTRSVWDVRAIGPLYPQEFILSAG